MPSKLCTFSRVTKRCRRSKPSAVKRSRVVRRTKGKSPAVKAKSLLVRSTRTGRDGKTWIVRKKKTGKPSTGKYWARVSSTKKTTSKGKNGSKVKKGSKVKRTSKK